MQFDRRPKTGNDMSLEGDRGFRCGVEALNINKSVIMQSSVALSPGTSSWLQEVLNIAFSGAH